MILNTLYDTKIKSMFANKNLTLNFTLNYRERKPKAEPPAFLKKIGDCEVFKGMTAKFTACATGYPEPEVKPVYFQE